MEFDNIKNELPFIKFRLYKIILNIIKKYIDI